MKLLCKGCNSFWICEPVVLNSTWIAIYWLAPFITLTEALRRVCWNLWFLLQEHDITKETWSKFIFGEVAARAFKEVWFPQHSRARLYWKQFCLIWLECLFKIRPVPWTIFWKLYHHTVHWAAASPGSCSVCAQLDLMVTSPLHLPRVRHRTPSTGEGAKYLLDLFAPVQRGWLLVSIPLHSLTQTQMSPD